MKRPLGRMIQRLEAAALAAGTLWLVCVTAGSDTAAEAADALISSAPLRALRWELGDLVDPGHPFRRSGPDHRRGAAAAGGAPRRGGAVVPGGSGASGR